MNAQQLKNAILQEAIEGRLVPQDPNDEPASVLLARIRKEKERLVKEGKLKKKDLEVKPISEEEIPFKIPDSWKWVRLDTIFNHSSGKQLSAADTEGSLRKYITTSNLYWGRFELDDLKSMYYKDSELERCTAKKGDLLVCEGGDVGRSAIWPYDYDICLQNHIHRLRPYCKEYTRFVYYTIWFYKSIGDIGGKGIGIKGLSASALKSIIIPLPPLAEQHRIVEKIEELLPKVEEYGKAQEALDKLNVELPEKLKKSILQEAISGRLVPQDPKDEPASVLLARFRKEKERLVKEGKLKKKDLEVKPISEEEIPFEIPEGWEWCNLGTITTVLGGKRIPAGRKLTQDNTGHIYIRVSDMKEDTVSTDNLLYVPEDIFPSISRYIITKDDVYITVAGTIGRIGKIPPELDGANLTENADRLVFRNINQDWLISCLQSPFIQLQITDVTTKVGQPKLAILRIQNLMIPLPPLAEQHRIVAKIEELLNGIEKLKA